MLLSCAPQLYENLGMSPYDVLKDCLSAHWIAGKSGGVVVSIPTVTVSCLLYFGFYGYGSLDVSTF